MNTVAKLVPTSWIDPRASLGQQVEALMWMIKNPPRESRVITFSPKLSEYILQNLNLNNRNRRPSKIRRFSKVMAAQEWGLTGDTIKFTQVMCTLADGQNRLFACVLSGKPFTTHVVFGVEDKLFAVMDNNAVRTGVDTFGIAKIANAKVAAPAVRWLIIHGANAKNPDRAMQVTNAELLEYLKEHVDKDVLQIAAGRALAAGKAFTPGYTACHFYRMEKLHPRVASKFFLDLEKRRGGARKLITFMLKVRKQQMGRLHELQGQAMILLAFNCYRRGERVTAAALRWNETMEFPQL